MALLDDEWLGVRGTVARMASIDEDDDLARSDSSDGVKLSAQAAIFLIQEKPNQ